MSTTEYFERVIYGLPIGLSFLLIGLIMYNKINKNKKRPEHGIKRSNTLEYFSDAFKILTYDYPKFLIAIGLGIILMAIIFFILAISN